MAKFGKISTIKKQLTSDQRFEKALESKGYTRLPGTGIFKYPYKELDGKYRTGLDPEANYIKRIQNDTERALEIERVTKLRAKLEAALEIDLGPRSKVWNSSLQAANSVDFFVQPEKLMDGDNFFDFTLPIRELQFAWLRVHPTIAPSLKAWQSGEYREAQFYVVDEDLEADIAYKSKKRINDAIVDLAKMTPDKMRKVARQLGLPVTNDTKEEMVYNLIDSTLRETEFKKGPHAKLDPISVFNQFAKMDTKLLDVKDTVKLALVHNIYRSQEKGRIYEGATLVANTEEELVKYLMDDDNQHDLLMLGEKVKGKMIAV